MSAIAELGRGIGVALRDGRVKSLLVFTLGIVLWASAFYHYVEGWSWVDSIYFCIITISTVGYGDFSPVTTAGKIFTIFYIIVGFGVFVAAATTIADTILKNRGEKPGQDK